MTAVVVWEVVDEPPPSALATYHDQRPQFVRCEDKKLAKAGATCATIEVPLDYADPGGATVDVAVSRLRAGDPEKRRGILMFNPGGPGGPGLDFPLQMRDTLGKAAEVYDLIGFDPRFVGKSMPISCGRASVLTAFQASGSTRAAFDEAAQEAADFAGRCHERHGNVLPHAGTSNVARDMDVIRAALGEDRVSYYGVSYGAELGAVYSQLFPDRVDRFALDSTTAGSGEYGFEQSRGPVVEAALDEWAAWAADRHAAYGLGASASEVRATVADLVAGAASDPIRVGESRLDDRVLPLVLQPLLEDEHDNATMAELVRSLVDASKGAGGKPPKELVEFLEFDEAPGVDVKRGLAAGFAVSCNDGSWPSDPETYWRASQRSLDRGEIFGTWVNRIGPCAYWDATSPEPPLELSHETPLLIVQAERDNNTPLDGAIELHRKLRASHLVTADVRAHGVYVRGSEGLPAVGCIEQVVNDYLRHGTLPAPGAAIASPPDDDVPNDDEVTEASCSSFAGD